jgi:hypothetical protein
MHSFSLGDSAEPGQKARYTEFFARLAKFARLEEPWTVVIRWAADCSQHTAHCSWHACVPINISGGGLLHKLWAAWPTSARVSQAIASSPLCSMAA